jgi:hypothetical protein
MSAIVCHHMFLPVPSQDLDFKWAFNMVLSSEVNSEMFTEVKYQTKFILNTLPLVEGIMVDYQTRKKISPETNVEDDHFCQSVVIYHNPLH